MILGKCTSDSAVPELKLAQNEYIYFDAEAYLILHKQKYLYTVV